MQATMQSVLVLLFIAEAFARNPEASRSRKGPKRFEGDMILDPTTQKEIDEGLEVGSLDALARKATKYRRWPNGVVPYTIAPNLKKKMMAVNAIRAAFNEYKKKTCITFVPRTTEAGYLTFTGAGKGCYSKVGRTGKQQMVNLGKGCWYKGIAVHEIGHALGFFHEQSRPDRDDYVKINKENIRDGSAGNFKKYSVKYINTLNEKYDYGSIMHYGKKYFSKNRKPTIEPLQKGVVIGQRKELSEGDARMLNKMYCKE